MRYAFVAEHRRQFPVRAMCRCLRIQPSGLYAWLKNPLSRRAREDARQIELLDKAWKESGRVYGYRKLHDDLLDQGETSCANRERIRRKTYRTREEARQDVFDYTETFYNPKRKHVRNRMLSPVEFKRQHNT